LILSNGALTPTSSGLGDITPSYGAAAFFGSTDLALGSTWAAYGAIYKSQLWVGTVVRKLAMATARMPFDIKLALRGNEQEPENGALAALMARPNDHLSGFALWLWTSSTYDIYGEAFWLKLRDQSGRVRELHPIHPTNLVFRRTAFGEGEYVYAGSEVSFHEDDVVAFVGYNPENLRRGISNLEGLRMTLLNEDASRRATASWWSKGARPSVILKHDKNLSAGAIDRLKAQFDQENSGASNMGKTLILEEAMDATVVQLSSEEMQYIESRKLNREEVCAAYDVPPPVVHILDKATFSNITEQLRSMYRDTMAPRFELFESVVDHQLVPDFYPFGTAFTKFNMDEVLRGDFETRATAVGTLIEKGVMTPNEARPMFNFPPVGPEGDILYGNAALIPLGSNARTAQPVATDGTLIPQQLSLAAPTRTTIRGLNLRGVMGRLGTVKAAGGDTRQALVDEHARALSKFFTEQRDAILAAGGTKAVAGFDPAAWDGDLADILTTLSTATAQTAGTSTATALGGKFDGTAVKGWVADSAMRSARKINRTTRDQVEDATSDLGEDDDYDNAVRGAFDGPISARADQIAITRVAIVAEFASLVAAQQSGAATKTWNVNSGNPRPEHSAVDGETVPIEGTFSNGMSGPGDPAGGADEVAGCDCTLTFDFA
jgi:HK97 family phage portal protein